MRSSLFFAAFVLTPALAVADPCTAPLPHPGQSFFGPVRYIVDGDGLCVGSSSDPATWIEVRLADFYAPELNSPGGARAKQTLDQMTRGRSLTCVAGRRSYDRVVAQCRLDDRDLGDLMRQAGIAEGGNGR